MIHPIAIFYPLAERGPGTKRGKKGGERKKTGAYIRNGEVSLGSYT